MTSEPIVMPTKVSEMNCRFCGSVENLVWIVDGEHAARDIEVVAVEEHAGADQPEDAIVKRADRQAVEPRARVDG